MVFVVFYLFIIQSHVNSQPNCDQTKTPNVTEGNIGETKHYPWLGVLRVHSRVYSGRINIGLDIYDGKKLKIGLTGLVLIKQKYGVVNAHDVAGMHKSDLARETKAMFILKDGEPWSCAVKDRHLHPEYEYITYNTIALIELDYEFNDYLIPICTPNINYNTKNQLYALGYVDDNRLLEKAIYNIDYVNRDLCDDFYNRVGFKYEDNLYKPTTYYCGFAKNNKNNCVWENGMVLASNTTGVWVLIGFSIKGPGCASPIRFLDILSYLPWIETSTDEVNIF